MSRDGHRVRPRAVPRPACLLWGVLAASLWAGPVSALDLAGAKKTVERILHKKTEETKLEMRKVAGARSARQDSLLTKLTGHPAQGGSVQPFAPAPLGAIGPGMPGSGETEAAGTAPEDSASGRPDGLDGILLSPDPYYYQSLGRRDPFASLIDEDYLAEHVEEILTSRDLVVTGILWGENDRFALVETTTGRSVILRDGDQLGPFTVTRVEPEAVVLYRSEYGVGKTIRLSLAEGKGSTNARGDR